MNRKIITPEELKMIRELDILTYFKNYDPNELVKEGENDYVLNSHNSLHIKGGKWSYPMYNLFGTSALDYLIKVEKYSFLDACNTILDLMKMNQPVKYFEKPKNLKEFKLPEKNDNNEDIKKFLMEDKKIEEAVLQSFFSQGMIYQDRKFKNIVYVGFDEFNPAFAFKQSIMKNLCFVERGSNKKFSFNSSNIESSELHVFDSPLNMLSYMSILYLLKTDFMKDNYLFVCDNLKYTAEKKEADIPTSLRFYLEDNPNIEKIIIHFENDEIKDAASKNIEKYLNGKYEIQIKKLEEYNNLNEKLQQLVSK